LGVRKSIQPVKKLSDGVLPWLSVWSMVQLMPLTPHHLLLQLNPEWFTFLVPAYPGCPGKRPLNVYACVCMCVFFVLFQGYMVRISGGNDKQGFPMKQGVLTTGRVRLLLSAGHSCYRPRRDGERRRKSVRGCIVDANLSVLNLVIIKKGALM